MRSLSHAAQHNLGYFVACIQSPQLLSTQSESPLALVLLVPKFRLSLYHVFNYKQSISFFIFTSELARVYCTTFGMQRRAYQWKQQLKCVLKAQYMFVSRSFKIVYFTYLRVLAVNVLTISILQCPSRETGSHSVIQGTRSPLWNLQLLGHDHKNPPSNPMLNNMNQPTYSTHNSLASALKLSFPS